LAEQQTLNLRVLGSIPRRLTTIPSIRSEISRSCRVYLTHDETAFLNVDVDVFAKYPLEPLAAALGDDVSLHYVGRVGRGLFQLHFALYSPKNADSAIRGLAKVIGSLPRSSRHLWNNASRRVFDLGFQGGFEPYSREFDITEEARGCDRGSGWNHESHDPHCTGRRSVDEIGDNEERQELIAGESA
jgi:hypothetical protein